jgi:hypothetical protein
MPGIAPTNFSPNSETEETRATPDKETAEGQEAERTQAEAKSQFGSDQT